jgi:hypothetical protein
MLKVMGLKWAHWPHRICLPFAFHCNEDRTMTDSPSGKTTAAKFRAALRQSCAILAAGAGLSLLAAPAHAGTVVIGTRNLTISTPGFFLSIGDPVIYSPGVVYRRVGVHPGVIRHPVVGFPTHPIYPRRTYQRIYRVERHRPTLSIHDATPPIGGDGDSVYPSYPGTLPDTSRYTLVTPYLEADTSPDPIARFTSNALPWLEVESVSAPTFSESWPVNALPEAPQSSATTYRLSSPSPFNQSLGTLD